MGQLHGIFIKVILWLILRYLNRISLWEEYPLMLIIYSNMEVLWQKKVPKKVISMFYSWTAIGSPEQALTTPIRIEKFILLMDSCYNHVVYNYNFQLSRTFWLGKKQQIIIFIKILTLAILTIMNAWTLLQKTVWNWKVAMVWFFEKKSRYFANTS